MRSTVSSNSVAGKTLGKTLDNQTGQALKISHIMPIAKHDLALHSQGHTHSMLQQGAIGYD